jgi:hypothetical protein
MPKGKQKLPIFKDWRYVYAFIAGALVAMIISLYLFTQYFK